MLFYQRTSPKGKSITITTARHYRSFNICPLGWAHAGPAAHHPRDCNGKDRCVEMHLDMRLLKQLAPGRVWSWIIILFVRCCVAHYYNNGHLARHRCTFGFGRCDNCANAGTSGTTPHRTYGAGQRCRRKRTTHMPPTRWRTATERWVRGSAAGVNYVIMYVWFEIIQTHQNTTRDKSVSWLHGHRRRIRIPRFGFAVTGWSLVLKALLLQNRSHWAILIVPIVGR